VQEVERLLGVPMLLNQFMSDNCATLTENRWGKFVVYNWVKLNPDIAIPFLLELKRYDL
jgi:hypothetical protein